MSFYSDVIQKDPRFHSTSRVVDLSLLEPVTRASVQAILAASPTPIMVFETYRSQERQAILYAQKATELKTVGVHHYGLACDLVKNIMGDPSWKGDFTFLKKLAEDNGLLWGGDWGNSTIIHSFVDEDHVQRINVADQNRLFAGWYPDDSYRPEIT